MKKITEESTFIFMLIAYVGYMFTKGSQVSLSDSLIIIALSSIIVAKDIVAKKFYLLDKTSNPQEPTELEKQVHNLQLEIKAEELKQTKIAIMRKEHKSAMSGIVGGSKENIKW